jgi:hypothetical protein
MGFHSQFHLFYLFDLLFDGTLSLADLIDSILFNSFVNVTQREYVNYLTADSLYMPLIIPEIIKDAVLQDWLSGSTRNAIATKNNVSEGSVSNIVAEKKKKLQYDSDKLEALRDLSIAISRSGLSIQDCTAGHRIAMLLRKTGVDEERFEDFMSKLWHLYIKTGLNPELLREQVSELHYFLSQNNGLGTGVSIFRICDNINTLKSEEAILNHGVVGLKSKRGELERDNADLQEHNREVRAELEANIEYRDKLKANGFQKGEILESVDLALLVKRSGYTIGKAIEKFSDFAGLDKERATLHQEVLHQGVMHNFLSKENLGLEELRSKNSQILRELEYVKQLGFGLQELKKLRYKLDEVDEEAGKPTGSKASIDRFFRFLDNYYCDYYNLEDKVKELQSTITESGENLERLSMAFGLTPDIAMMIHSLARKGISKYDIPDLVKKIEDKHHSSNSISFKIDTITTNQNSNNIRKPPLISQHTDWRTLFMFLPRFDLGDKEITECPPCGGGKISVDEHETRVPDGGGGEKAPSFKRRTGEIIDKGKVDVRSNTNGTAMKQLPSEEIYDTKTEYKECNNNNKNKDDCEGYFHPQFPPSLVEEAKTMRAVRKLPLRIGIRWKLQSGLGKSRQVVS